MDAMTSGQRANYVRDGISAWEEYVSTGMHVTFAEADAWLLQLERGEDVAPPECHS